MSRSRLPALLLSTLPALALRPAAAEAATGEGEGRYPTWPTEIDRIAAPLRDPAMMAETARLAALDELREFATEVILPDLELALTDPSPEVRNHALQICASRRILECIDEAEAMWEEGEGSVRLMALELLSQDPSEDHLELVKEAMRDPNDLIREHAINLLVDAPLSDEQASEARKEIVAQLGDVSARVRRTAAHGLGRLGPGEGGLALVRLLDDIDQGVAQAAAFGLGQLADARTAPALRRSLENPTNPQFAIAAAEALARLPGEDIDLALLELLDTPPRNLRRGDVAQAIGGRPEPGPKLIGGLVDRMRDPDLREPTTQALLWLGQRAVPQLEAAIERGLEPDIAIEVERLLAATRLERTPRRLETTTPTQPELRAPLPESDDRQAWIDRLVNTDELEAGAELGKRAPDWLDGALAWQIERASTAAQIQPWLTALAVADRPLLDEPGHVITWGQVARWALDEQAGAEDRCLASLALGRAVDTRHADEVREELRRLAAAHLADVRGCAALSLARFGDDPLLEALLADPSPRVRALAALALRTVDKPDDRVRARLALQADTDSEVRARSSAALSLREREDEADFVLLRGVDSPFAPGANDHWQRFDFGGELVDLPIFAADRGSWVIAPLAGAVLVEPEPTVTPLTPMPYYDDFHGHM